MPTDIKAIDCPNCGSPQKTELRPGDYRCQSCGTEYFIDDGTVKFGRAPLKPAQRAKTAGTGGVAIWIAVGLTVGILSLIVVLASTKSSTSNSTPSGYSWSTGYDVDLYLSADKRPILLTLGTKAFFANDNRRADFVAFNDVRDGSVIAMVALPDAASVTGHSGRTDFNVREFSSGDIFIIAEKTQLFRVRKTSYTVTDVSGTLFNDLPELSKGIAKIEFIYPTEGEGFKLITNEGKNYFYYPLERELHAAMVETGPSYFDDGRTADNAQKAAVDFSDPWNSDYPDIPAQLISFRYQVDPYVNLAPELRHVEGTKWDAPENLRSEGVVAHSELTPGRIYFDYGVLYFDDEYVLISYRLTPGANAPRYVQLLTAKTAAVVFTSRLDVLYAPTRCIRYPDGFAIFEAPDMFTLSLSGKLEKLTPVMYGHD